MYRRHVHWYLSIQSKYLCKEEVQLVYLYKEFSGYSEVR